MGGGVEASSHFSTPPSNPLPQGEGETFFLPLTRTPALASPRTPAPAFILNTGRVRDQWHSMTRTGLAPALMAHTPEPRLAIHPADAARVGLDHDALARIDTEDGSIVLRADLRHSQRRGEVFVPMHWTDAFASAGPIARTVTARTDPFSGQPALKSSRACITPVPTRFHGLLLRHGSGPLPHGLHWTRIPVETGQLYRLAGLDAMPGGAAVADLVHALVPPAPDVEWLELRDPARQVLRAAALRARTLHAALFLAADPAGLPRPDAIIPLLRRHHSGLRPSQLALRPFRPPRRCRAARLRLLRRGPRRRAARRGDAPARLRRRHRPPPACRHQLRLLHPRTGGNPARCPRPRMIRRRA